MKDLSEFLRLDVKILLPGLFYPFITKEDELYSQNMLQFYSILILSKVFMPLPPVLSFLVPHRSKLFSDLGLRFLRSYNFTLPSLLPTAAIVYFIAIFSNFWLVLKYILLCWLCYLLSIRVMLLAVKAIN